MKTRIKFLLLAPIVSSILIVAALAQTKQPKHVDQFHAAVSQKEGVASPNDAALVAAVLQLKKIQGNNGMSGAGQIKLNTEKEIRVLESYYVDGAEPTFLVKADNKASGTTFSTLKRILSAQEKQNVQRNSGIPSALFDPLFSPDGKNALVKYGAAWAPGSYLLYFVNLETGVTKQISGSRLNYYAVSWAPDGKFVAFATGGGVSPQAYQNGLTYQGKLNLCIYEVQTGKIKSVVTSDSLRGPWSWIAPHTLTYSTATPTQNGATQGSRQPSLYSYSWEAGASSLLKQDSYSAVVAPDGKRVAFLGDEDTQNPPPLSDDWLYKVPGKYVIVDNLPVSSSVASTNRLVLSQHYGTYPNLFWEDNDHVLVTQETYNGARTQFVITEWDATTGQSREISNSTYEESDREVAHSDTNPVNKPLRVIPSLNALLVKVNHFIPQPDGGTYFSEDTIKLLDLRSGKWSDLATATNASGIDAALTP